MSNEPIRRRFAAVPAAGASARAIAVLLLAYAAMAYVGLPEFWTVRERHLTASIGDFVTRTPQGIPGDPINVGFLGEKRDLLRAFAAAGWNAADPITLRSSVEIGLSVLLDRPYRDAPVSTLVFEGRNQDLSFERPAGVSADRRHHVRLWEATGKGDDGRPLWLGAATFDRGVGLSHDTLEITHHIAPDVDAERDLVIGTLEAVAALSSVSEEEGLGPRADGRNGGGDRYVTDGMVKIGVLRAAAPDHDVTRPG
jgi:hypothetical protein